jgi:hypothetical protein
LFSSTNSLSDRHVVGQRAHLTVENRRRLLHPILRGQLHDLRLKLQILVLGDLEAVEQLALFGQHDQHVIALLGFAQHTAQVIELGDILRQRLRIPIEQQTHGQRTQAQHVLTHLANRHHARQPVVVDLIRLGAHVRHLQQGERPKANTIKANTPKPRPARGAILRLRMLITLVPSKSAASTLQLVALEGIGPAQICVRPKR